MCLLTARNSTWRWDENDDLRDAYQRLVGQADVEAIVRIQLVFPAGVPELHALPRERPFHRLGTQRVALTTSAQTPFSRFLDSGAGDQPPVHEHPLRLLMATASLTGLPDGCSPLDVADEAASLADLLAGLAGCSGLPDDLRGHLTGRIGPFATASRVGRRATATGRWPHNSRQGQSNRPARKLLRPRSGPWGASCFGSWPARPPPTCLGCRRRWPELYAQPSSCGRREIRHNRPDRACEIAF